MKTFIKNNSLLISKKLDLGPTPAGSNSANYKREADWNSQDGNVTTVGSNGGPSSYGTYDQSGNLWEWNDLTGATGSTRGFRGGNWELSAGEMSSTYRITRDPSVEGSAGGFRLSSSLNPLNLSNFESVEDAGNANDSTGFGGVSTNYLIGKYPVTNYEYAAFLNSVDPEGINPQGIYSINMSTPRGGIARLSGNVNGSKYQTITNMSNKPVNYVSWFDAARYCNWLHNGRLAYNTTNDAANARNSGAYNVGTATTGNAVSKESNAAYHIPTENEWYKAAYYKGGGTNTGYWLYATQSNLVPTSVYATSVGDGIIPIVVLGNLNNNYSKTSTTIVSVSNAALGFNTNNDSKLKVSAIVLRSPTLPTSVNIYSNSSGVPGSILFSSSGYTSIGNGYNRYYFNSATLSSSSIYWVVPGVNWGLTTENGNLANINNTPIAMNNSSYSFVDVLQQIDGVWSSYSTPNSYVRNLTFSLECY